MKNALGFAVLAVAAIGLFAVLHSPSAEAAGGPGPTSQTQNQNINFTGTVTFAKSPVLNSGTSTDNTVKTGVLWVDGGEFLNSTLIVDGGTTLNGALTAKGISFFDAGVMINSTLMVDGGITVGLQGGPVTLILPFTTAAIDFASTTTTCTDSSGDTATGASTGDGCVLGMPSTLTSGGTGLNASYTCYVSAANTVKVRHCAAGSADDPGSVVFHGWIFH